MKRREKILSITGLFLALVMIAGLGATLLSSTRAVPGDPIAGQASRLYPESLEDSDSTLMGQMSQTGGTPLSAEVDTQQPDEPQEPDKSQEPDKPQQPDQPQEPDNPQQPDKPQEPDNPQQPDTPQEPDQPQNPDDPGGGKDPSDDNGGKDDSGNTGGNTGGDDGNGGQTGGDGEDGKDDDTPRIYTDLRTQTIRKKDLPDGKLSFVAYPLGKGENLYVRVRLMNKTYTGNGHLLTSSDGQNYQTQLDLNTENTFVLSLYDGSTFLGSVQYRVSYYADLASEDEPDVGEGPPSIMAWLNSTQLGSSPIEVKGDGELTVRVTSHPDLGAKPIYSDQIEVTLDGKTVEKFSGDREPEYKLYFAPPQRGDVATHIIRVRAWDGQGNSAMRTYTVTYHQISEGDDAGTVTVVLDATTVGIGILDSGEVDIKEGDTVATAVLQFLRDYGYEADYAGNAESNFYLRRIISGDMAYNAEVPEHLWTLIQRDGITTNSNYDRDSLGEFDFTQGAGWMYSIGGMLFPGRGMSDYKASDGLTIYLRFTLAYGKDVGGYESAGGSYGSLSSYCGLWVNGSYQPLSHDMEEVERVEPTETEDGYVRYVCSKCHEESEEVLPATGETEPEQPNPEQPEKPDPGNTDNPDTPTPGGEDKPNPGGTDDKDPSAPGTTEPDDKDPDKPGTGGSESDGTGTDDTDPGQGGSDTDTETDTVA